MTRATLALSGATSVFRGAQTTLAPGAHRPGWSAPGSAGERGLHMRLAFHLRADEHGTPLNAMHN